MRQGTKIALIVVAAIILVILIALIVVFTVKVKPKTNTPLKFDANEELRTLLKDSFNSLMKLLSSTNTPIPDIYRGCSGSTINRIQFCNQLKYNGSINVGGTYVCEAAYQPCQAACTVACGACKIIPFVGCSGPCDDCPNECHRVYKSCTDALAVQWSVNVMEAFDLGNTFSVADLQELSVRKTYTGDYSLTIKLVVSASPSANIDIRTTAELANYQGAVTLGNLKFTIPLELVYQCKTGYTVLKTLGTIQIDGLDLQFDFPNFSDFIKKEIYKVAKRPIENAVKSVLQDKLTSVLRDFISSDLLPKLHLSFPCS